MRWARRKYKRLGSSRLPPPPNPTLLDLLSSRGSARPARHGLRQMRALRGSADALGQRDDDPFRPPDVGHPPSALVLADATNQAVALGSCPIDSRLQVVDLEGHVAQSEFVGHGGR